MPVREPSTTPCGIVREGLLLFCGSKNVTNFPTQFFTMNNTIIALFQTLNVLSMMLETFAIVAVRVTITAIVLGQYFIEGCKVVYNNRQEILEKSNNIRNAVGYQFAYAA